jgi:hypothetical protein
MEGIRGKTPFRQICNAARKLDMAWSVRSLSSRMRLSADVRSEFLDLIPDKKLLNIVSKAVYLKGDKILQLAQGLIISKVKFTRREIESDGNRMTEEVKLMEATVALRGMLGSEVGEFKVPVQHIEHINWDIK